MLNTQEGSTDNSNCLSNFSETMKELKRENQLLNQRVDELIVVEQQLLMKISHALYIKRQENEEKKEKIKLLEHKCETLGEFLKDVAAFDLAMEQVENSVV